MYRYSYNEKKFGWLLAVVVVIAATLFILTCTTVLTHTSFYASGTGEVLVENVIDSFESGNRIIVINRDNCDDLDALVDRVYDEPSLFWVDLQYNALSIGNISILRLREKYPEIESKQKMIEKMTDDVLQSIIKDSMTDYEKTLAIHDWICENVTYAQTENDSDQDIYGALILKKARCAGYAKAFAYMLDKVGIKAKVISGDSINKTGITVPHAWNLIYINNVPCYFDITWNDQDDGYNHDWFGITSDEFKFTHFPSAGYEWVSAKDPQYCYNIRNGMYIEKYSASNIAAQIRKQGMSFTIKCANRNVLNATIQAFNDTDEMLKLMNEIGLTSVEKVMYTESQGINCLSVKIIP